MTNSTCRTNPESKENELQDHVCPRAESNRRRRRTWHAIHSKGKSKWMKEETWNAGAAIDPTTKKGSPSVEERNVKRRGERRTEREPAEGKEKGERTPGAAPDARERWYACCGCVHVFFMFIPCWFSMCWFRIRRGRVHPNIHFSIRVLN
jgi:hypothetical protein